MNAFERVASVNDDIRIAHKGGVIECRVVGYDHHAIGALRSIHATRLHHAVVESNLGYEGIRERNLASTLFSADA